MASQPKDPSQDGHQKDNQPANRQQHGLQPRQMGRIMGRTIGRSMNRFEQPEQSNSTKSGLDKTVQAKMENAFQSEFSDVNIIQNSAEASSMGAMAFTQGNNIHFAPGQYNPNTAEGQELIGHELTHVIQQKQGRVKATTQAKGVAVNDDPALEKEADVMGKKAASGQHAIVQKQSNKEEENKEPENNSKLGDPEPDHPYMKVIGWGRSKDWSIFGTSHTTRFIYSGKASDWKKLLATLDSDRSVIKYLSPFLAALGCGSGNVKYNPYKGDYTESYEFKEATPSETEILELLKALYDTNSSTKSSVDLPNEFWMEGGSNVPRFYDMGFDGLAEFISKYQTLLIEDKSAQKGNVSLEYDDVKKLATEGTRWSDPMIKEPRVVQAMIDNAFATALAATKHIVASYSADGQDRQALNSANQHASMMITNSATVISAAIDSYGASVLKANQAISSVFDQVWDFIPVPKAIPSLIERAIKKELLSGLTENFSKGSTFGDTISLKKEYESKFINILSGLENISDINWEAISDLRGDFDID